MKPTIGCVRHRVNVLVAKQRNGPRNFSVQLRLEA